MIAEEDALEKFGIRMDKSIVISPVGRCDPSLIESMGQEITRVFGFPSEAIPLVDDLSFAFNWERRQYHSTAILDILERSAPPQALKVIALADVDLFIPILTHVYGEAQLGGRACVVSTFRLDEGISKFQQPGQFRGRVLKETIHELGHTFKLRHCREKTCIMHYCRQIQDVDLKSGTLCRYCRIFLRDEIEAIDSCAEEEFR